MNSLCQQSVTAKISVPGYLGFRAANVPPTVRYVRHLNIPIREVCTSSLCTPRSQSSQEMTSARTRFQTCGPRMRNGAQKVRLLSKTKYHLHTWKTQTKSWKNTWWRLISLTLVRCYLNIVLMISMFQRSRVIMRIHLCAAQSNLTIITQET